MIDEFYKVNHKTVDKKQNNNVLCGCPFYVDRKKEPVKQITRKEKEEMKLKMTKSYFQSFIDFFSFE